MEVLDIGYSAKHNSLIFMEIANRLSSKAFYARDDPLEAVVFSVSMEIIANAKYLLFFLKYY